MKTTSFLLHLLQNENRLSDPFQTKRGSSHEEGVDSMAVKLNKEMMQVHQGWKSINVKVKIIQIVSINFVLKLS